MEDYPKTKDTLEFEDRFFNKIKDCSKSVTIRNSPVSLGYKQLSNGTTIEVLSCEKIYILIDDENKKVMVKSQGSLFYNDIIYSTVGFNNSIEMYEYYKKYLKRKFAFAVTFEITK